MEGMPTVFKELPGSTEPIYLQTLFRGGAPVFMAGQTVSLMAYLVLSSRPMRLGSFGGNSQFQTILILTRKPLETVLFGLKAHTFIM